MHRMTFIALALIACTSCSAAPLEDLQGQDLVVSGQKWLRTQTQPFNPVDAERTYKVFTHVYDFAGQNVITKGAGGKFTHHRGLFIGWKDTLVKGEDYDTWHMSNCYQQHVNWQDISEGDPVSSQEELIEWRTLEHEPILSETRRIVAHQGEDGMRVVDFESELTAEMGDTQLRGDLQHAGMQIRMADEVNDHQDSTQYIMPDGAEELEDDKVVGAWWMCGSVIVEGKRYWVLHMTAPDLATGEPVYSIRRYARFGAFFEPDLKKGEAQAFRFRFVISDKELNQAACQALYAAYALEHK